MGWDRIKQVAKFIWLVVSIKTRMVILFSWFLGTSVGVIILISILAILERDINIQTAIYVGLITALTVFAIICCAMYLWYRCRFSVKIVSPQAGSFVYTEATIKLNTNADADEVEIFIFSGGSNRWYRQPHLIRDGEYLTTTGNFGEIKDKERTIFKIAVVNRKQQIPDKLTDLPNRALFSEIIEVYRTPVAT